MDLVTGGTGFIGRHVVGRWVAEGRRVRVLCRPGSERKLDAQWLKAVELCPGDMRDAASLSAAVRGVRRVIHCAGAVSDWGDLEVFRAVNVNGTRALLAYAAEGRVERFVHLSSIAVFGTPAPPTFDDDSPYGESRDGYSVTKVESEKSVLCAQGLDVVALRPGTVYGPGSTWLEEPLKMVEQGRMFLLGGGRGTCHPCFIENLVDAIALAADHPKAVGRAYIVGDGEAVSFREYFDAVARIAGKPPIRRSIPLPIARLAAWFLERGVPKAEGRPLLTRTALAMVCTRSTLSMRRIQQELGYQPRFSFAEAVKLLESWYADPDRRWP